MHGLSNPLETALPIDLRSALAEWRRKEPLRFSPEALNWVFGSVRQMAAQGAKSGASGVETEAERLVGHLRLRAEQQFGGLATAVLTHWGLKNGNDLQSALESLGQLGAVHFAPGETLEGYAAIGSLLPHQGDLHGDVG
jgi:uncharacterized repeat protein (TIGR04138 family)